MGFIKGKYTMSNTTIVKLVWQVTGIECRNKRTKVMHDKWSICITIQATVIWTFWKQ